MQNCSDGGHSRESDKNIFKVDVYLKEQGYHIVPVNPFADEIRREKTYKSRSYMLTCLQETIDIVNIFRPAAQANSKDENILWKTADCLDVTADSKLRERAIDTFTKVLNKRALRPSSLGLCKTAQQQ
jgi:predicted CoA-binding protein